jgi:hypothetical protein
MYPVFAISSPGSSNRAVSAVAGRLELASRHATIPSRSRLPGFFVQIRENVNRTICKAVKELEREFIP